MRTQKILLVLRGLLFLLLVGLLAGFISGRGVFAGHGLPEMAAEYRENTETVSAADAGRGIPVAFKGQEIRAQLERLAAVEDAYREILDNYDAYPEPLLSSLCTNSELLPFVQGYLSADGRAHGGLTDEELAEEFPLFLQWDARWGYADYGDGNIALSGCAPTCLSMVVVALTKNRGATPAEVADYAEREGYYIKGTGTSWSFMTEGSAHYGICGRELCLDENVVRNTLRAGHPIICSMRPGNFTTAGHFIVLAGVRDGKIIVRDPNSRARSEQVWDYASLAPQIKNLWSFSVE